LEGWLMTDANDRPLRIAITYCAPCQFLARATWIAQELLTTFQDYTQSLELVPGRGGTLDITVNGKVVFSKHDSGRYPEMRELKESIAAYLDDGAWRPAHAPQSAGLETPASRA
jgi:selenoprotein W-related protein